MKKHLIHFAILLIAVIIIGFVFDLFENLFNLPEKTDEVVGIMFFIGWIFWAMEDNSKKIEKLKDRVDNLENKINN